MALTYIETVRLLMGDLDEGDNNFFTADQWAHQFGTLSYDDDNGDSKVSLVEVAIDTLRILSIYHADSRPERSKKFDDRVDALSRWPNEQKALYLEDGVPDGIGMADAFRGPMGLPGADSMVPGPRGLPGQDADPAEVDGPIAAHDAAAPSHGAIRAKAQANEDGLETHIAAHPGGVIAGPPGDGTVSRAKLTPALRADVDAHANQSDLVTYGIHFLTAVPANAFGVDGQHALVRVSSIVVHAYKKVSGAWVRLWAFSGGEAVLLAAGLPILPARQPASDPATNRYSRWIAISGYAPFTIDDWSKASPPIATVSDMRGGSTGTVNRARANTLSFASRPISFDYSAIEVYLAFYLENNGNAHGLLITSVSQGGVDIPIVAQGYIDIGNPRYSEYYLAWHSVGTYTQAQVESGDYELVIEKDPLAPNTYNRYAVVTQNAIPTADDFMGDGARTSPTANIAIPLAGWENGRGYLHFGLPATQPAPTVAGIPGSINLMDDFNIRSTDNTVTINGDTIRTLSSDAKVLQVEDGHLWTVR